jgi:hypothetical protein
VLVCLCAAVSSRAAAQCIAGDCARATSEWREDGGVGAAMRGRLLWGLAWMAWPRVRWDRYSIPSAWVHIATECCCHKQRLLGSSCKRRAAGHGQW